MHIIDTDFGIAYRYGDTIEINPILKDYPRLYEKVLEHELGHSPDKQIDFWHDFTSTSMNSWEGFKFSIQHPIISLQTLLPVWHHKGEWHHNNYAFFPASVFLLFIILIGVSL